MEALEHFHRVTRRAHVDAKATNLLLAEADTEVVRLLKLAQSGKREQPAMNLGVQAAGAVPGSGMQVQHRGVLAFHQPRPVHLPPPTLHELCGDERDRALSAGAVEGADEAGGSNHGDQNRGASSASPPLPPLRSDTKLKMGPLPDLVLQLLHVRHLEQQVIQLEQEKQAVLAEKEALMAEKDGLATENRRLHESVNRQLE